MPITLNGDTGITTPGLINTGSTTLINLTTTGNTILGDQSTDTLNVANGNLVLNSSGNLGVGTTSPLSKVDVVGTGSFDGVLRVRSTSTNTPAVVLGVDAISSAAGYVGTLSNLPFQIRTNDTERARIDSSGNLGLGVTPSAWGQSGTIQALQIKNTAIAGSGAVAYWGSNWFGGGFDKYIANGAASLAVQISGAHQWYTAPSGTAGNAISFTQAMTLDASGVLTVPAGGVIQGLTVGRGAGAVSTNTAVGVNALAANTTGGANVAVGNLSLDANTTGANNIGIGANAMGANSTGSFNVAIGDSAMGANTTANDNVAVGQSALDANTTGAANVAIGRDALGANTTASNNTAVGYQAGLSNTTGTQNVAVGDSAFISNTTGSYNTAIGRQALAVNTTSSNNTAVGYQALYSQTTSVNPNVAVGKAAGYGVTTGGYNVIVGELAGYNLGTGSSNTFIGVVAGYNSTGSNNTFIGSGNAGYGAGWLMTSGSKNTILGAYSGNQGGLDIRSSNNNIVLSDGDGNPRAYHNGYNWFSTSGGFISKLGGLYSNSFSTNSSWSTGWNTIIPINTIGRGAVVLVHFLWNYSDGGQPYYLDACTLFTSQATNGTGGGNAVTLMSATHTGSANYVIVVRTVAGLSGASAGLQVQLVDVTNNGVLYVNAVIIGA